MTQSSTQRESDIKTRYLVVGLPRSGTTLVHTAIMGHPCVSALSDEMLVYPFFNRGLSAFTFGNEFEIEKQQGHRALFDAISSIQADGQTTALGVKCCAQTTEQARVVVSSLREHLPDLKVVLTVRKDLVAQYGSLRSARSTNAWHSWSQKVEANRSQQIGINRLLFVRYALRCLDSIEVLRQLRDTHDVYECEYESLLGDRDGEFQKIFKFLGVSEMECAWLKTQKVKPPPDQYITNYAQMKSVLDDLCVQHEQGRVPSSTRLVSQAIERAAGLYYRYVKGEG